ncbi:MAG: PH domain-containing protein [Candidatus Aenigmatarchaeota archaeon]
MATTIEKYPLEKRKIIKKTVKATFSACILFLIGPLWLHFFFFETFKYHLFILDFLFAIFPLVEFLYQREYFKRYFYDAKDDFLVIRKGVFAPTETILPYEKLQDVYVDQDVFDRIFKLYDVHVSTATFMSGIEAHIDGVNKENAEAIREIILENIRKSKK